MKQILATFTLTVLCACGSTSPPPPTAPAPEPIADAPTTDAAPPDEPQAAPDAAPAPDPAQIKADLLAAELAAYEQARPVLHKHCASCHTKDGKSATSKKLGHFDMTSYPFGGHHAGEMSATLRKVLGLDGSKPTMPKNKPGAVAGDELAVIAAWADAFDASHQGGAHEGLPGHEGHGGGHPH